MSLLAAIIPGLNQVIGRVADKFFPDPADALKRQEITQDFIAEVIKSGDDITKAAANIIKAEAHSTHWLAANWRPLTMLIFVGLITARWFGFAAPNLTEPEYLKLWDIVELGLGGYVIGRSVEKVVPALANATRELKK